ncbi:xylose isomerase, partial [Xanthomonas arboricola pv. juglandis]
WRAERYASFDSGAGADFANGSSTLVDLAKYAAGNEPKQLSGRQEAYENLINQYLTR